jgi:CHAT domain-containing protein
LERAQCWNFQKQLQKSEDDAARSLKVSKEFPVLTMRVLGIIPGINRQQQKYEDSWTGAVEGLKIYWQGAYPLDRLDQFYAVMFQDAEDSDYPYLAESLLRHDIALRTNPENGMRKNPLREGLLHLKLAKFLNARQVVDEAKKETQIASSILQSLAGSYPDNYRLVTEVESAENDFQHQEAEQALSILKAMASLVNPTQNKELALNYYRLLGGVYLKLGQLDEAATSFDSAIEIADAGPEASWKQTTEESYRGAVRVLLAQRKDREALDRWEQFKGRISQQGPPALIQASTATSRNSVLQFLSSPGVRLVYATFADGVQIWSIKNGRIQSHWVKVEKIDLENDIRVFAEQCATPDSSLVDLGRQGLKLYALLLQPVAAELAESKTVIVELDQSAYNLSLESLKTPAGHYFGEEYAVVYSPGLWTEQLLRSPGAIGQAESLFLLDATRSADPLPGMQEERTYIAKTFPRSKAVDGENANWENSRHDVAASQIFIFMGHGRRSNTGTKLELNSKESLGSADFTPDRFAHSEMVVLSACSSARGGKEGLLDNQNLVHSFLAAGVPRIIASHWDVDSNNTSQLMVSFYRHALTDATVAEAMLNARREVLEKTPHPYYWAGFSVIGRVN